MKPLVIATLTIIILLFRGLSATWGTDKVDQLAAQFGNPPLASTAEGSIKVGAATELDKYAQEWRMQREQNKLIECGVVSGVALLSLVIVLGFMRLSRGDNCPCSKDEILNTSGLILIIFATIFIVVVADVEQQLSASIGILGAIAGYIFGRKSTADTPPPDGPTGGTGGPIGKPTAGAPPNP